MRHVPDRRSRHGPPDEPDPRRSDDIPADPDFAGEHTPSPTDPPNARPDDGLPDEHWDDPTGV